MMLLRLAASFLLLLVPGAMGFIHSQPPASLSPMLQQKGHRSFQHQPSSLRATTTSEEARALALSEYLIKAHEDKLKAIQQVESAKQVEIENLKLQIEKLRQEKGLPLAVVNKPLQEMSKEELITKIVKYQKYMQNYMIHAQEEKQKAVQVATMDAQKKVMELFKSTSTLPQQTQTSQTSQTSVSSPLYEARNAKITAAGKSSRWGDAEVQRVSSSGGVGSVGGLTAAPAPAAKAAISSSPAAPAVPEQSQQQPKILPSTVVTIGGVGGAPLPAATRTVTTEVDIPPEVQAADHGLRADGGVGGPSLAERVAQGSSDAAGTGSNVGAMIAASAASASLPVVTPQTGAPVVGAGIVDGSGSLYTKRNAKVLASAKAGKSRWGHQEIDRINQLLEMASLPATAASTTTLTTTTKSSNSLYNQRNAKVLASAQAGKSRWGQQEIDQINKFMASLPSAASAAPAPAEVVAAPRILPSTVVTINGGAAPRASISAPTTEGDSSSSAAAAVEIMIPPEVVAADHGLRADGGVGGMTLAERVAQGSGTGFAAHMVPSSSASMISIPQTGAAHVDQVSSSELYQKRNVKIVAASHAGKSRWGAQEIDRAEQLNKLPPPPTAAVAVPPEVQAADHGLRADGGVGGPSLAERIAQGSGVTSSGASSSTSAVPSSLVTSSSSLLYSQRNIKVLAAAKAGMSRWGQAEIDRVENIVASSPSVSLPMTTTAVNGEKDFAIASSPRPSSSVNVGAQIIGRKM